MMIHFTGENAADTGAPALLLNLSDKPSLPDF